MPSPAGPQAPKSKGWFERVLDGGVIALVMVVLGVVAVGTGVKELILASAGVPSKCAVLETSTRKGKRDTDFVPQVRIAHEVGGKRYERLDEGVQRNQGEAQRALAAFPKGATVACKYVEGRPEQVIVFEDRGGGLMLGFGSAIILIAVLAYFGSRKRPSAEPQS